MSAKRRVVMAWAAMVAVALSGVVLGACGDDGTTAPSGTFVGTVEGSAAAIAVVTNGELAAGYMCDSKDVSVWFVQSKIADDKATLTTRSGKKVGTVSFDEAAAQGEVSVDGVDGSFRVSRAGGDARLYRGLPTRGKPTRELGSIALPRAERTDTAPLPEPLLLAGSDPALAMDTLLAITWIRVNSNTIQGAVAELSRPLPRDALDNPFAAGLDYPSVEKVLGEDDVKTGPRAVRGQPDLEVLAGTTFRFRELGPEDLGS